MSESNESVNSEIIIIGLGTGDPDTLSLGAFNHLVRMQRVSIPIYARTKIHPTVDWLASEHGITFTGSFDHLYDHASDFESVYEGIVEQLLTHAIHHHEIGYAVPGHPSFAETAVQKLRQAAPAAGVRIKIVGSLSWVDSVLERETTLGSDLRILDALDIIRKVDRFSPEAEPFDPDATHLISQVYDRAIASELKLALLEHYPPESKIAVITAAGNHGSQQRVQRELSYLDHAGVEFNHLTSVIVYPLEYTENFIGYRGLLAIMARLRNPNGGCPWDLEQTPQTLRKYIIEEAFELVDVIDSDLNDNIDEYCEELGDILLQVIFHAQIAREADQFSMHEIIRVLSEKLIRRHPHVFSDVNAETPEKVLENWATIKTSEKTGASRKSILDGVPRAMPALLRAHEISKRAAKAGFEWDSINGVFDKLTEEINELHAAIESNDHNEIESEIGDLLFTIVNLARFTQMDSEKALGNMIQRFCARFSKIEEHANMLGKSINELTQPEMEQVWQSAKMSKA